MVTACELCELDKMYGNTAEFEVTWKLGELKPLQTSLFCKTHTSKVLEFAYVDEVTRLNS